MRTSARRSSLLSPAWISPIRPLQRYLANRRTVHALAALDDRQLADIGLTRLDVEWADTLSASSDIASELDRTVRRRVRPAPGEDVSW
jgi:uncharacterized protein YjiS (DUF1127 family)